MVSIFYFCLGLFFSETSWVHLFALNMFTASSAMSTSSTGSYRYLYKHCCYKYLAFPSSYLLTSGLAATTLLPGPASLLDWARAPPYYLHYYLWLFPLALTVFLLPHLQLGLFFSYRIVISFRLTQQLVAFSRAVSLVQGPCLPWNHGGDTSKARRAEARNARFGGLD